MIRRTFDATFLNEVVNHPDVRPYIGGNGELDVSASVSNPSNFALVTSGGGFIIISHEPGVYEVHTQFLPEARNRTVEAMQAGMDYMFTRTDCYRLLTKAADTNRAAAMLALKGGFVEMFKRDEAALGPTTYYVLDIERWAQRNPALDAEGERFHDDLAAAKSAAGSSLPIHQHDQAHERAVGAAMRMIMAGNAAKGVTFYNRWAALAGYATITLISETPLAIDVVDAVVGFDGQNMEILLCR